MTIKTKFSPNDIVTFNHRGERMRGAIYSVIATAFHCYQIVSYDVMYRGEGGTKICRVREDELTKIKTDYVSFEKYND